jgi:hypothetical protein
VFSLHINNSILNLQIDLTSVLPGLKVNIAVVFPVDEKPVKVDVRLEGGKQP